MTNLAIVLVFAAAAGMLGATLGVRDLKRKTTITIERGKPKPPFDDDPESAAEALVAPPQADLGF